MKNILIGNGINIQFGGLEYTSKEIIIRAMKKLQSSDINPDITGIEILQLFGLLYIEVTNILNGMYDLLAVTSDEKTSLSDFKERYLGNPKDIEIYDIGFEDYFLIFELFCRKNKISNPELFHIRGTFKRFFIDSIFNEGKIQKNYLLYPKELKDFFLQFDNIFTTNYDKNIQSSTGKQINYLHGAFHIIDDVYNPDSFRNQLPDKPAVETPIIPGYEHLFSNVITSFSGFFKEHIMNQPILANSGLSKAAAGIKKNPAIEKEIIGWAKSDDLIPRNLGQSFLLKKKNDEFKVTEYYPIEIFKTIKDELVILGLSPFNDNHVFNLIDNNEKITSVVFYFFTKAEIETVKNLCQNRDNISFRDVKSFWDSIT